MWISQFVDKMAILFEQAFLQQIRILDLAVINRLEEVLTFPTGRNMQPFPGPLRERQISEPGISMCLVGGNWWKVITTFGWLVVWVQMRTFQDK